MADPRETRDTDMRCPHAFKLADGTVAECDERVYHSEPHAAEPFSDEDGPAYFYVEWHSGHPFDEVQSDPYGGDLDVLTPQGLLAENEQLRALLTEVRQAVADHYENSDCAICEATESELKSRVIPASESNDG